MNTYYNREMNLEILISLLKKHEINQIIASPGMTNSNFVASLQADPYFTIYSAVDERSAAYMACGLAEETQKPVVISCTGATASREWASGLTEAFYRHLPVLAVTSSQPSSRIGHLIPQVTDRNRPMPDMVNLSVDMPLISSGGVDERALVVIANEALLELKHRSGGPVHINLITNYDLDFSVRELPDVPLINRVCYGNAFPDLSKNNIVISFKGNTFFDEPTIEAIDNFCALYGAVIVVEDPLKLKGFNEENVLQEMEFDNKFADDSYLLIQVGNVNTELTSLKPKEVWRVSTDGEIVDLYRKLTYVFEMRDKTFFDEYNARVLGLKKEADKRSESIAHNKSSKAQKESSSKKAKNYSARKPKTVLKKFKSFLNRLLKK